MKKFDIDIIIPYATIIIGIIMIFIKKIFNMEIVALLMSFIPVIAALFIMLQFIINFKKLVKWVKPGLEGNDGRLDFTDISLIIFTLLFCFIVISTGLYDAQYPDMLIIITASGSGVLSGINAARDIFGKKDAIAEVINKTKNSETNDES